MGDTRGDGATGENVGTQGWTKGCEESKAIDQPMRGAKGVAHRRIEMALGPNNPETIVIVAPRNLSWNLGVSATQIATLFIYVATECKVTGKSRF
jgi:hypothetical protein